MNIYDVSKQAGVSIATVSRVINGNPNVSNHTRDKVLKVMEELGYTPNVFARGLGLNTMKTIGIMCSDSSDMYMANAIFYLERELRTNDYDAILCCTGHSLENKRKYLSLLLSKRVDAIILIGSKFIEPKDKDNSYIYDAALQMPIMLINGHLDGKNIYSTLCDDYTAMYNTTSALIKNGRKDIIYLHTSNSYSSMKKKEGYMNACIDGGLRLRDNYMYQCEKNVHSSKKLLTKLHNETLPIDAVVTSTDILAVGAIKFALSHHISIPDEINIVGYDDSLVALCAEPEITSVDTKVEALCITTVNTLMGVFNSGNVPNRTMISAQLIKRQTTNF